MQISSWVCCTCLLDMVKAPPTVLETIVLYKVKMTAVGARFRVLMLQAVENCDLKMSLRQLHAFAF
jgi:hypothetical protein